MLRMLCGGSMMDTSKNKKTEVAKMKQVKFDGKWHYVLDETNDCYICSPQNRNEGYHWITKNKVTEIEIEE